MDELDLVPALPPVPIRGLRSIQCRIKHFPDHIRETFLVQLQNVRLTGRSIHYPNCLLQITEGLINPYDERIMSLQKDTLYDGDEWSPTNQPSVKHICLDPVYFFIYNVDNYYHFIYDALPILAGYFFMRKTLPTLQLLIQTSHPTKKSLPPFVTEMLRALGIISFQFANKYTQYNQMIIGTSLTHGRQSNSPPSPQAYSIWNNRPSFESQDLPKRFYVSRRSWAHGQTVNVGTNYTTRRKCVNEMALVYLLKEYGIIEIFTECLSTEYKLAMFAQADVVVGVIGGGMCNLLFSPQTTKSLCIVTPEFLKINERFKYSMEHTQITYSYCTNHVESPNKYTLYTRIKVINPESPAYGQLGEIEELLHNAYVVRMLSNDIAEFSQDFAMESRVLKEWEVEALDGGLNSPYICDLAQVEQDIINLGLKKYTEVY